MSDAFISYSRKNSAFVRQLVSALEAEGKTVWWDQKREALEGIVVGAPWWEQIKIGIEDADNFIFVISPHSIVSPYCHAEINQARFYGKRLVTVLYCGWISEQDTWEAISTAIDSMPEHDYLPDEVTLNSVNFRSLVRQNWLSLNEIQHAIFSSSTSFEEPFGQLVKALDLDLAWVKLHNRLRQAALLWEENGRSEDFLWPHGQLKPVYESIDRLKPRLEAIVQDFIEPEQARLLREIEDIQTSHIRRSEIGERLSRIGDPRPGVGVRQLRNGQDAVAIPELAWCYVPASPDAQVQTIGLKDHVGAVSRQSPVSPFYVGRYPITHCQFETFLTARDGSRNPEWWRGIPSQYQRVDVYPARSQHSGYPRDGVSWYESIAFTRWLDHQYREFGLFDHLAVVTDTRTQWAASCEPVHLNPADWQIRLPFVWEWQWAAQGGAEQREYPWGSWDEYPRANTVEAGINAHSTAVGIYPHGMAICGALDMAGNILEWCLNNYAEGTVTLDDQYKDVRGGSFAYPYIIASNSDHFGKGAGHTNNDLGLRVVCAPPVAL